MCNCVLRNATRSCEGLNLKFDQPSEASEVTFKDVSGNLTKSCPSYKLLGR